MNRLTQFTLLFVVMMMMIYTTTMAQQKKFTSPASADAMQNPMKGNESATTNGKLSYTTYCVPCHGDKGKGNGVAAAGLSTPPADHTSAKVQGQTDGAIFWKIYTGNNPMPSYKTLTQTQIWELVNYIRTLSKSKK